MITATCGHRIKRTMHAVDYEVMAYDCIAEKFVPCTVSECICPKCLKMYRREHDDLKWKAVKI